jgi:hypothetical protein
VGGCLLPTLGGETSVRLGLYEGEPDLAERGPVALNRRITRKVPSQSTIADQSSPTRHSICPLDLLAIKLSENG